MNKLGPISCSFCGDVVVRCWFLLPLTFGYSNVMMSTMTMSVNGTYGGYSVFQSIRCQVFNSFLIQVPYCGLYFAHFLLP